MKEENILQRITREYNTQENWDNAPKEEPDRQLYFIKHLANIMSRYKQETGRNHFFHLETFGCQMNARDSEKLVGILEQIGYIEEPDEEKADFVIYNTCTVRENANQRVYGRLGQLGRIKKKNPHMMIEKLWFHRSDFRHAQHL